MHYYISPLNASPKHNANQPLYNLKKRSWTFKRSVLFDMKKIPVTLTELEVFFYSIVHIPRVKRMSYVWYQNGTLQNLCDMKAKVTFEINWYILIDWLQCTSTWYDHIQQYTTSNELLQIAFVENREISAKLLDQMYFNHISCMFQLHKYFSLTPGDLYFC